MMDGTDGGANEGRNDSGLFSVSPVCSVTKQNLYGPNKKIETFGEKESETTYC